MSHKPGKLSKTEYDRLKRENAEAVDAFMESMAEKHGAEQWNAYLQNLIDESEKDFEESRFVTGDELLARRKKRFSERYGISEEEIDEVLAKGINKGIEELERGEGLDGEKVMVDLREKSRQRRAAIEGQSTNAETKD